VWLTFPSARDVDCRTLVAPETFESVCRQLRITHGVLNVPMTEVVLDRPCVVALVGKLEAAGVAQHGWVDWEAELRVVASASDDLLTEEAVIAPRRSVVTSFSVIGSIESHWRELHVHGIFLA
jgi:hypothetical protein